MTGEVLPRALAILQRIWGYNQFRGVQARIVQTVAEGGHALVLMPTGGGKSLCYQLPSLLRPGVGVVVSPLIALMKDQVDTLRQLGVRAAYLNSTLSASAARAVEHAVLTGGLDLLYVAPERLLLPRTLDLLHQAQIALFAIDEAHCVSQWGHDFRPEYQQLSVLEQHFPQVPRLALTATADDRTRADIRRVLGLTNAPEFISSFDRPNIQYRIANKEKPRDQLLEFIQTEHPGDAGVVYCLSRRSVEETAAWLQEHGLPVVAYHAGLAPQERNRAQERFLNEEGVIVVATVAFGMGIDKPNVRFVAHLDLPKSLEGYYQETGRAGRDGLPSTAWMVYGLSDVVNVRRMLADSDAPEDVKRIESGKLDALLTYCETASCRRQVLLGYFGEPYAAACGNCDVCLNPPSVRDMTREAQMALSAAIRTGNRFGAAYLTDILLGKDNDKNRRHRTLPTYGIGKEHDGKVWRSVLRQLVSLGYLTAGPYHGLTVTPQAKTVLKGQTPLLLREDTLLPRQAKRTREKAQASRVAIGAHDKPLFLALRAWRAERAAQLKVPPYVIFSDATLKAIAEVRPGSLKTLGTVSGIGERRLAEYGSEVLRLVRLGVHGEQARPRGTVQAHELGLVPEVPWASVGSPARSLTPPMGMEHPSPTLAVRGSGMLAAPSSAVTAVLPELPRPLEVVAGSGSAVTRDVPEKPVLTPDAAVTVALGETRRALARETGYAAYLIFPNATLTALATRQPRTMAELVGLPGLGPKRIEAYGDRILDAIASALAAEPHAPREGEQAVQDPRLPETTGLQNVATLLERVAMELRSGRAQFAPLSLETVWHEVFPKGTATDFDGYQAQDKDGVTTLVLRLKREK
ncbi:DNA helicase RecQ [Deinococcus sp. QL22]|uniref:DNA helicase RecQ n=1 Tax=Deinococcus sp. QL22 TaxID=2939437 RepID=UPI0020172B32|nr:DNA helicase RecQ [Deinococcus sp. QL22]UQN09792.1 DNA helicase RecQ [Deinococcus sp. QL22]